MNPSRRTFVLGALALPASLGGCATAVGGGNVTRSESAVVAPVPKLILALRRGRIVAPTALDALLTATPRWARPIASAALKLHLRG